MGRFLSGIPSLRFCSSVHIFYGRGTCDEYRLHGDSLWQFPGRSLGRVNAFCLKGKYLRCDTYRGVSMTHMKLGCNVINQFPAFFTG